jgi:hypothetical protein
MRSASKDVSEPSLPIMVKKAKSGIKPIEKYGKDLVITKPKGKDKGISGL